MRFRSDLASSLASALPSCRLLLLFAGVLVAAESAVLGAALAAAGLLTFAVGVGLAASIYRSRVPAGAVPVRARAASGRRARGDRPGG